LTIKKPQYIIFTDLDGTLLDHDSYSFHEAQEALLSIKEQNIPLIFCTSKTRAELEVLQKKLDNNDPFIVENGAAIFIPRRIFESVKWPFVTIGEYHVLELGTPYQKIKAFFKEIKVETGLNLIGFSEMALKQIARSTGLSLKDAALAKKREYSEPFMIMEEETRTARSRLKQAVQKRNLKVVRGGRFYHLTGPNDKGKAVRLLIKVYQKNNRSIVSIGLGDSPNDFPMLKNVNIPVLIKKTSGNLEPWPGLTPAYHTREIGPKGWNDFIMHLLKEAGHE
jgi:mannosyl-3-phosphoglycerate phosphatase